MRAGNGWIERANSYSNPNRPYPLIRAIRRSVQLYRIDSLQKFSAQEAKPSRANRQSPAARVDKETRLRVTELPRKCGKKASQRIYAPTFQSGFIHYYQLNKSESPDVFEGFVS